MTTDPTTHEKGIPVEAEALNAMRFYDHNYVQLMFEPLGPANKPIVLRTTPFKCRFCGGEPPARTFRKCAHAVSELLGNKVLRSLYECDDCNVRFSAFEDDLGKMTLPFRTIGGVCGGKGFPTLVSATGESGRKARMEFKDETPHVSHHAGDNSFRVDEATNTVTFSYIEQPYRPLGAYKALCKSAFTLLRQEELVHFRELRQWLLQSDVTTDQVYIHGSHDCFRSFVPGFRPFPQPVVALLRRMEQIEAPYMSMFIAFGNISYQIFLPCPAKDEHLRGKNIGVLPYPHVYQLQPWRAAASIQSVQIDLSASERTKGRPGTVGGHYERREKVV